MIGTAVKDIFLSLFKYDGSYQICKIPLRKRKQHLFIMCCVVLVLMIKQAIKI